LYNDFSARGIVMKVYATLKVDESKEIKAIHDEGKGAVLQIGFDRHPIISVDADTNLVEIGFPETITYH
jgi:hypothetical protein|tara:strand:- start:322 stop:528 length:207 start_codon:yes stop_codon:yes gene_type:complete